jgi:hypothetical protein
MSRIEQIKAEQKKLADELEGEMLKERVNVLAKMKEDIKLFGFKTSDFKGVLATRKKRGTGTAAKKTVAKKTTANPLAPKYIIDDSVLKQGKFTAGTQIQVVGSTKLEEYVGKKVVVIILAWNFATEIIQRISKKFPSGADYECVQFFPSFKVTRQSSLD